MVFQWAPLWKQKQFGGVAHLSETPLKAVPSSLLPHSTLFHFGALLFCSAFCICDCCSNGRFAQRLSSWHSWSPSAAVCLTETLCWTQCDDSNTQRRNTLVYSRCELSHAVLLNLSFNLMARAIIDQQLCGKRQVFFILLLGGFIDVLDLSGWHSVFGMFDSELCAYRVGLYRKWGKLNESSLLDTSHAVIL